jgi:hypothetical protein
MMAGPEQDPRQILRLGVELGTTYIEALTRVAQALDAPGIAEAHRALIRLWDWQAKIQEWSQS